MRQRKRRKAYLMETWASDVDGYVRCFRCGLLLDFESLTVDRIKPGCEGGTYQPHNIRPACADCNQRTGSKLGIQRQKQRRWQQQQLEAGLLPF